MRDLWELSEGGKYVFRGFSFNPESNSPNDKDDSRLPSIMRAQYAMKQEEKLLTEFEYYGSSYYSVNNPLEFMACAQHYGLPTRLLDFSCSPFIALYFSINRERNKNRYFLTYANSDNNILVNDISVVPTRHDINTPRPDMAEETTRLIDIIEKSFSKKNNATYALTHLSFKNKDNDSENFKKELENRINAQGILFVKSNLSNERLLRQQGLFMFAYDMNKENHLQLLERNATTIEISTNLRTSLLEKLNMMGINQFTLMPELSSVCDEIISRASKNRRIKLNIKRK